MKISMLTQVIIVKPIKILVFGLPGSGKTVFASNLAQKIRAHHVNADEVRERFNDWDFSEIGRKRQVKRMLYQAKRAETQYVILDFVCPREIYRALVEAEVNIFMDTIFEGRFADTNALFERPKNIKPNFHFKEKDAENNSNLVVKSLITSELIQPNSRMLGRYKVAN
jgi:adenylylsulfate kinase-like enzyme